MNGGDLTTHITAPAIQSELYMEVKGARYWGYDSSVTSIGAAFAGSPTSSKNRDTIGQR